MMKVSKIVVFKVKIEAQSGELNATGWNVLRIVKNY
jgi:hypothetical protein